MLVAVVSAAAPAAHVSAKQGETWYTGTQWIHSPKLFPAANFTLPDQRRKSVSLRQFRGKVVLLSFTSSVCTGQCPLVARGMYTIERALGPLSKHTVLLNVSVDPASDTRKSVYHFAKEMGWLPYTWHYLWSTRARELRVWKAYGVYDPPPPRVHKAHYDAIHLAVVAMVDQKDVVRGYFPYPFNAPHIARGVKDLVLGRR
ncbi:MAG: SCO family protein [Chloroflexota bacterium]